MKRVVSNEILKNILSHCSNNELLDVGSDAIVNSYDFHGKIAFLCGNNTKGFIALACAYKLSDTCECVVFLDGNFNNVIIDNCRDKNVIIRELVDEYSFDSFDTIIDGLFDSYTFDNTMKYEKVIKFINNSHMKVVSIDINSGLNPDTGIGRNIIKSDLTISLGSFRYGHFLNMSKDYIKNLINYKLFDVDSDVSLLEIDDCKNILNNRSNFSNKYDYGLVTIIGGSNNYSGSIKISNMAIASMRSGSGLCRICVPKTVGNAVLPNILESTLYVMPSIEGKMVFSQEDIDKALDKSTCLVIGMGWGESEEYFKILDYIFNNYDKPIIIDADGINTLSKMDLNYIKNYKSKVILTPHLGEFSRLVKQDVHIIMNDMVGICKKFAKDNNCILLLKGSTSIITDGDVTYLVNRGCSGMATAGSGDALSGILGGLIAYNEATALTVATGAYINGMAGEEAEKEVGAVSLMARDTISKIPDVIKKMSVDNY